MREHVCAHTYTHAHTARPFREGQGEAVPWAWDCPPPQTLPTPGPSSSPTHHPQGEKHNTAAENCWLPRVLLRSPHAGCHRDSASLGHIWLVGGEGGRDEGGSQKYTRDSSKVNYTYSPSPTPTHPLPPCPQLDAMGGVSIAT